MKDSRELKVFLPTGERDSSCCECGEPLGPGAWITLLEGKGALCLACSDLDHLVYLPSGDAALTRRARRHSTLWAVVLKWSRARKRYERQGLLVEEQGLQKAEAECLADGEARARRREREALRRVALDAQFITQFAERVRALYPACPPGRETIVAEHACRKHSGRVGRSAAGRGLDDQAVRLAVTAHLRHAETRYDELLARGIERWEARQEVAEKLREVLSGWERREEGQGPAGG